MVKFSNKLEPCTVHPVHKWTSLGIDQILTIEGRLTMVLKSFASTGLAEPVNSLRDKMVAIVADCNSIIRFHAEQSKAQNEIGPKHVSEVALPWAERNDGLNWNVLHSGSESHHVLTVDITLYALREIQHCCPSKTFGDIEDAGVRHAIVTLILDCFAILNQINEDVAILIYLLMSEFHLDKFFKPLLDGRQMSNIEGHTQAHDQTRTLWTNLPVWAAEFSKEFGPIDELRELSSENFVERLEKSWITKQHTGKALKHKVNLKAFVSLYFSGNGFKKLHHAGIEKVWMDFGVAKKQGEMLWVQNQKLRAQDKHLNPEDRYQLGETEKSVLQGELGAILQSREMPNIFSMWTRWVRTQVHTLQLDAHFEELKGTARLIGPNTHKTDDHAIKKVLTWTLQEHVVKAVGIFFDMPQEIQDSRLDAGRK